MVYDLIILGSGPAGLSAAVYSLRYNMKLLVIGMEMGTIVDAEKVDNYMGFSSISGIELAKKFPAVTFHIVGGKEKDLFYWRKNANFDNLIFHGFVEPQNAYKYRNMCDIL